MAGWGSSAWGTSPWGSVGVGFDAASESHTGSVGSKSQASFSWTHTPVGTPQGVLIFVIQDNSSTDKISSVTYGGTTVPAVSGGLAADTVGEPRLCKAFFLGASVPTGAQTVVVNRTNDTTEIYAVATTVVAQHDTEVYTGGIVLQQADTALAEQSVNDASSSPSLRFAGLSSALGNVPAAGANSTAIASIDLGAQTAAVVRETTGGQGSRSVGFSTASVDDVAAVYLAVRELQNVTIAVGNAGIITLTGAAVTVSTKISVTPGHVAFAGKTIAFGGSTIFISDAVSTAIWDSESVTWSSTSGNWDGAGFGNLFLTGQPITLAKATAVTPGAVTLTGKSIAVSRKTTVTPGVITLDGVDTVVAGATNYLITPPTITLAGASVSTVWTVTASPGAVTMAGAAVPVSFVVLATQLDAGAVTLSGRIISVTIPAAVKQPPHDIVANPELRALHKLRKHYGLVRN